MKIIAALAMVGAANAAIYNRKCQEPDVVQNLDIEAYLGLWYEMIRDKDTNYESGYCDTASYSLRDEPNNIRVRNNDWYYEEGVWGGGVGTAFQVDPSKDDGYLKVKFVPAIPAGDYKILDTDYDNFTLLYSCIGVGPFFAKEYVWVLARDPIAIRDDDVTKSRIMNKLKEQIPLYDIFENGYVTPQAPEYPCPYDSQPE